MRYYAVIRPVMVGTVPKGMTGYKNFDKPEYVEVIGREAWGYADYDTEVDISDYDLIPENALQNHLILKRLDGGKILISGKDFPDTEMDAKEALGIIKENNYTYEWR